MRVFLIVLLVVLLSCGTRQRIHQLPAFAFYQTDSGSVWVYRNHERAEVIGPFLIIPAPDTQDSAQVVYFPNGMQPPADKIRWVSCSIYTGSSL